MYGPRGPGAVWGPGTNPDGTGPAVHVFSNNDVPNIRSTGAPEMTKFRSSFDPEPQWLDDPTWYGGDGPSSFSEVKDGLRLDSTQRS